jgi:hypothetical protein
MLIYVIIFSLSVGGLIYPFTPVSTGPLTGIYVPFGGKFSAS